METRYYYTSPLLKRETFLSRMSGYIAREGNRVLDAVVSLNISPRITTSITAESKRQILDAKLAIQQEVGIKLVEKLF